MQYFFQRNKLNRSFLLNNSETFFWKQSKYLEKIGSGYTGTVYRLDDETIIKVMNNMNSIEDIQRERDAAQKAFF